MKSAIALSGGGVAVLVVVMVLLMVAFVGLVVWVFSSRRKRAVHEAMARLPLATDDARVRDGNADDE